MSFTNLGFTEQTPLDPATANIWGTPLNENFTLLDSAFAGNLSLNVAASTDVELTEASGAPDQSRNCRFVLTGAITSAFTIYFPVGRTIQFSVNNKTTGNHVITIAVGTSGGGPSGDTVVAVQAANVLLYSDGTNINQSVDLKGIGTSTTSGTIGDLVNASMSNITATQLGAFTADMVIVGETLSGVFYELASYSQSINLATTGAGGMDTGLSPVSGFVSLYAIYNPGSTTTSILAQNASGGSPTIYGGAHMPAGYTASALIGIWPTDASRNFAFGTQKGRSLSRATAAVLSGGTSTTYTTIALGSIVPVDAVSCDGYMISTSASNFSTAIYLASYGTGTAAGIGEVANGGSAGTVVGFAATSPFAGMKFRTSRTLYYRVTGTGTPQGNVFISGYAF